MNRYNWMQVTGENLNDRMTRRAIHTESMTIAKLRLAKGAIVPLHSHHNEQVTMLESGSLRFEMGGEEIVLKPGDALVIPPRTPHFVEALEDSMATDLFTPRREDWIAGDDSYLRKAPPAPGAA